MKQQGNLSRSKMIAFMFLSLVTVAIAQYPYQIAPGNQQGHQPQGGYTQQINHQYQPQAQNYQQPQAQQYIPQQSYQAPSPQSYQAPSPQSYQAPSGQSNHQNNPAAVHYVNIGSQLQGDYKFGYDTGKGTDGQSFREETRLPDGSVQGAYGYVDANGKQRIVRYTAGKDGYKAEGDVGPDGVPPSNTASGAAPQQPSQQYNNNNNYGGHNGYQRY